MSRSRDRRAISHPNDDLIRALRDLESAHRHCRRFWESGAYAFSAPWMRLEHALEHCPDVECRRVIQAVGRVSARNGETYVGTNIRSCPVLDIIASKLGLSDDALPRARCAECGHASASALCSCQRPLCKTCEGLNQLTTTYVAELGAIMEEYMGMVRAGDADEFAPRYERYLTKEEYDTLVDERATLRTRLSVACKCASIEHTVLHPRRRTVCSVCAEV